MRWQILIKLAGLDFARHRCLCKQHTVSKKGVWKVGTIWAFCAAVWVSEALVQSCLWMNSQKAKKPDQEVS
jgi:hypothetical protein